MDYRTMFDSEWVRAWDLGGKPCTVTITKVEAGVLENHRAKKKDKKPVVWFKGASKPLALNKTNAKTIAALYGNDTTAWLGKAITIYPTQTSFGNEQGIDCIRVKPEKPKGKGQDMPAPPPPPAEVPLQGNHVMTEEEREPGSEG